MSRAREAGRSAWDFTQYIDWFFSMEALVRASFTIFSEYVPDGTREYNRGEVVRDGANKWLLQNWGRLDPNIPLNQNPLLKLFRDGGRYEWVREEYCLKGFERYYDGDWYKVIAERADSAIPPPNDGQNWEKIEE